MKPRLLDLFCGAGGAAMGYSRAGFEVVGVDVASQPNYPFEFHQADALTFPLEGFDAIHASPPCQAYTQLGRKNGHPALIEPVRDRLEASGLPYVIENVVGAPLRVSALLCGSMFGLNVRRHRLFETNCPVLAPSCAHGTQEEIRAYYGKKGWLVWTPGAAQVQKYGRKPLLRGSVDQAPADMGIDWMQTWDELREAIPPAYCELIGTQLMTYLLASERMPSDSSLGYRRGTSAFPGRSTGSRLHTDDRGDSGSSERLRQSGFEASAECSPALSKGPDARG